MAVPSDRERLARLETRAREADNALKQLKSYVQLLKTKAGVLHPTIDEEDLVTLASVNQFFFLLLQETLNQQHKRYEMSNSACS